MSKIKNLVKVMNFHSLLRVDAAIKRAEKYFALEKELLTMIDTIINNQNFILDNKIYNPSAGLPSLTIYFGSDFGFCSNYNSQVSEYIIQDQMTDKIVLGKKVKKFNDKILLQCSKEEFQENPKKLFDLVSVAISKQKYSQIFVVYNRYNSISDIKIEKKCIYPVDLPDIEEKTYCEDFLCEGNINEILQNMTNLFLEYQILICDINTSAAENVLRQNSTTDSLKRIDEREEQYIKESRKIKKAKEFRKVIESYSKQKSFRR